MAAGGKQSKLEGWRDQAERLALKHTAVPALPRLAAAQAPRRQAQQPLPRTVPPAGDERRVNQPGTARRDQVANPAAKDFSREEALNWIVNARKEALAIRADRAKAAEARIAELEASLEAALERVAFLGNENQSLQTSLDLTAGENLELATRLAESETRSDQARAELLSSAVLQAEHNMAAATAERRIELLESLVAAKETRIQKLELTRDKLEQDSNRLIETIKARDKALADAEQKIHELTTLFEKIELRLDAPRELKRERNDAPVAAAGAREPQRKADQRANADATVPEVRLWRRQLDTDDWLLDRPTRQ